MRPTQESVLSPIHRALFRSRAIDRPAMGLCRNCRGRRNEPGSRPVMP